MDITLSDSEQQVRDGIRLLLAGEVTTDFVQSVEDSSQFPAGLWKQLARDGWLGVGITDGADGDGGSFVEWALVLEEAVGLRGGGDGVGDGLDNARRQVLRGGHLDPQRERLL